MGSERQAKAFAGIVAFAFLCASLISSSALAGEADLLLRKVSQRVAVGDVSFSKMLVTGDEGDLVPCLVKSQDPASTAGAIEALGGIAKIVGSGPIVSAHIPPEAIGAVLEREEVVFAEAAPILAPKMDTARAAANVVGVQDGSALGIAYRGTNIVVGVVDDGLDYGNPDFTGSNGLTRVQYVQQTIGGSTIECTHSSIIADTCGITDGGQGTRHGSHVTGIAASSNDTYTGVAPGSDIMFVFNAAQDADTGGSFATAVLEGVNAIFQQADALDKAAVVNLSLGTSIGAHDGTSLLEQGLGDLVGSKPGRIIVNAAGNEQVVPATWSAARRDYVGGIHAPINVAAGASEGWRIAVWNGVGAAATFTGGTFVDVWLEDGQKDDCSIAAFAYTQDRAAEDFTFPNLNDTDDSSLATGDVAFATDTPATVSDNDGSVRAEIDVDASDARNDKPHATVLFSPFGSITGTNLTTRWFDVVIRSTGAACSGHMWIYFDFTPFHDFLKDVEGMGYDVGDGGTPGSGYALMDGDSQYTTTIPATADKVIAAGSFMPPKPTGSSKSEWTGDNGTTYDQSDITAPGGTGSVTNDLSAFSSLGPTADGRTKPAVVAPGEPIISTKARNASTSSAITVGGDHFKLEGTSMASPFLAGIVALLLERNNTLTIDQVRTALQVGADTSGMTAKSPDPANSYGAGKVNAAQVLGSVSEDHSAYQGGGDTNTGSSSCSLAQPANSYGHLFIYAMFLIIALRIRRPRTSR